LKPKSKNLSNKILKKCWNENDDGAGFMYAVDGKLFIQKGFMTWKGFRKGFRKQEQKNNVNYLIHFRIGTSGNMDENNTHPFLVNPNIGFMHNGILTEYSIATSNFSDTWMFNQNVLKQYPKNFLQKPFYKAKLEYTAIAEDSKFAFMDNEGQYHIFNEKAGTWDNGCWFSNQWFKEDWHNRYVYNKNTTWKECVCCGDWGEYPTCDEYPICDLCSLTKEENNGGVLYQYCDVCGELVEENQITRIKTTLLDMDYCADCLEEAKKELWI